MPIWQLIHQRWRHSLEVLRVRLLAHGLTWTQWQCSRIAPMFECGHGWLVLLMAPTKAALQHHGISFHCRSHKQQLLLCCCIQRGWLVLLTAPTPAALQHHGSILLSSPQPYKLLADLQHGTGIMQCKKQKLQITGSKKCAYKLFSIWMRYTQGNVCFIIIDHYIASMHTLHCNVCWTYITYIDNCSAIRGSGTRCIYISYGPRHCVPPHENLWNSLYQLRSKRKIHKWSLLKALQERKTVTSVCCFGVKLKDPWMIALEGSETRSAINAAFSDTQRRFLNNFVIVRVNCTHPIPKVTEAKELASLGNHCMFKGTVLSQKSSTF